MDPPSRDNRTAMPPELMLGNWCYRNVYKQYLSQEILKQRQNSLMVILEGEQSEARNHWIDRQNTQTIGWDAAMFQRALYNTDDIVQDSVDNFVDVLSGRHPHRVRLMKGFPRPSNMPDKIFMEYLWCELKESEKSICEERLGADGTEREGGYKKAFQLLQRIHGVKHLDELLKEEVTRRWASYLKHDAGNRVLILNPRQVILGSRRLDTTSYPARPAPTESYPKRKDPPGGDFGGRKRAKVADTPMPDLTPQHLPNLADQDRRARASMQRPRRQSTLRREIRYEESSEVSMKISLSSPSDSIQSS